MDTSHLDAIRLRLSNERIRLASAKTERERVARRVWVAQAEKEEAQEMAHLGLTDDTASVSDADLLAQLGL